MNYAKKITSLLLLIASFSLSAQQYSKITYIHTDPDGTPFAATDEQGNLEWKIEHYPFGREFENTSQDRNNNISYAGKPYDEEIGLSYFGGRWYDPDSGRFTGIDPMPVQPNDFKSFNRYAYGFNNPYKYHDPDGNFAFLIPLAIYASNGLAIAGAGAGGYALGSSGYDLYSGRKTAGEAAKSAAIGVVEGAVLRGSGSAVLKITNKVSDNIAGDLALKAHSMLDPIAQKFKTTAVGRLENGKLGIASSDKNLPKAQRQFAEDNNLQIINGQGHAEETLINAGAKHVDASRGVCSDCQNLMNTNNVTTNTKFTGKKSRKRK